jgi:hypothetical protein
MLGVAFAALVGLCVIAIAGLSGVRHSSDVAIEDQMRTSPPKLRSSHRTYPISEETDINDVLLPSSEEDTKTIPKESQDKANKSPEEAGISENNAEFKTTAKTIDSSSSFVPFEAKVTLKDIERTVSKLIRFHPRLLVFDGTDFSVYNIDYKQAPYTDDTTFGRGELIVPLLIRALRDQFPTRFEEGQPLFQMLFLDSDSLVSECIRPGSCEGDPHFVPIPVFGSVPKETHLPIKAFPNWFYIKCLFNYKVNERKTCLWDETSKERPETPLPYEDLRPKLVWRGSDFSFLNEFEGYADLTHPRLDYKRINDRDAAVAAIMKQWDKLTPRWRAVALSAQGTDDSHWIDAKFYGHNIHQVHTKLQDLGVEVVSQFAMTPNEMATFKYQIDLGGGSGTAWRGTISKLKFPGLLFHHETPYKDWFYDEMKPMEHYVPIDWSLSDLKSQHEWAEKNPYEAKKIAEKATSLFKYMMSEEYMERIYQELFVDYLGNVVINYDGTDESWSDIKKKYNEDGFNLQKVSFCNKMHCKTRDSNGVWDQIVFAFRQVD